MKTSGIYKIQSIIKPCKVYIGSAVKIGNRWSMHLWHLRHNHHPNKKLQSHFNKYGESDLQFSILLGCDKVDLLNIEQYFIDSYRPWFNIRLIAESNLGLKASDTTKELRRQSMLGKNKGKPCWNKGGKASAETIAKRVAKTKGQKRKKKGPHTEKTRNLMREKALMRPPISDEVKLNMRKSRKKKPVLQFDKQGNFIKDWESPCEVERVLHISNSIIGLAAKGIRRTAGGFIWKYKLIS